MAGEHASYQASEHGERVSFRDKLAEGVDIYPVGLLDDLRQFVHAIDRRQARRRIRKRLRYPLHQARQGDWRAVKNYFNGYLAEPRDWPDGLKDCGKGWTRGRAYRDLVRRIQGGS